MLRLALAALFLLPDPLAAQDSAVTMSRAFEADGTTTLVHETIVPASAAEVWQAVSTAEGWMTWAVPIAWANPAAGTLETSYDPAASPGDPGTIMQQFVAVIPGRLLAFRTTKAPAGFPAPETYYRVTSVIELEPLTSGTHVRLTSVNFTASEDGAMLADFFARGNATTLEHLRQSLLTGPRDWTAEAP
jgi:uncharacterized protein YndB with AHSA1/START domain